jgi:hypothetical protein
MRWLGAGPIDFAVCEESAVLSSRVPIGRFAFETTAFSFDLVMPGRVRFNGRYTASAPRVTTSHRAGKQGKRSLWFEGSRKNEINPNLKIGAGLGTAM